MNRQYTRVVLAVFTISAACLVCSGCMEPGGNESPEDRWLNQPEDSTGREPVAPRKRFMSVIGLNPEKIEEYRKLHENIPTDIQNALHASDIYDYSVFVKLIDDQYYALRYYEFAGTDHEVAIAKLDVNPAYRKWRDAYELCQVPISPRVSGQWWAKLEEFGHVD